MRITYYIYADEHYTHNEYNQKIHKIMTFLILNDQIKNCQFLS